MNSENILEFVVAACEKSGVDEWELYLAEGRRLMAEAKDGEVDAFEVSESRGVAVRVRLGERPGFSYCADSAPDALKAMVQSAVSGAKSADPDPHGAFAEPEGTMPEIGLWDPAFDETPEREKIERALALENEVKNYDRRIARVRNAAYGEGSSTVRMISSRGLDRTARANGCSASVMAVAEENGQGQMGWDHAYSRTWAGLDVRAIARQAASDAVEMLGAKIIPTVKAPVVIRNSAAAELLAVLGISFLGEAVAKGKSMLIGKLGKKVFSDLITIYDDGLLRGGAASFPFDGEGVPHRTTRLAHNGAIQSYLYDLAWGRRAGQPSTGNAARGGYTSPPVPGLSNLYIPAGDISLDDIMKETGKGLLVKELMGVHTANPVSGDFSLGASGAWIEGGKPVHPVQGVTVAGNIVEMFACVDALASDLKFIEHIGAPSLRVSCLSISGQ